MGGGGGGGLIATIVVIAVAIATDGASLAATAEAGAALDVAAISAADYAGISGVNALGAEVAASTAAAAAGTAAGVSAGTSAGTSTAGLSALDAGINAYGSSAGLGTGLTDAALASSTLAEGAGYAGGTLAEEEAIRTAIQQQSMNSALSAAGKGAIRGAVMNPKDPLGGAISGGLTGGLGSVASGIGADMGIPDVVTKGATNAVMQLVNTGQIDPTKIAMGAANSTIGSYLSDSGVPKDLIPSATQAISATLQGQNINLEKSIQSGIAGTLGNMAGSGAQSLYNDKSSGLISDIVSPLTSGAIKNEFAPSGIQARNISGFGVNAPSGLMPTAGLSGSSPKINAANSLNQFYGTPSTPGVETPEGVYKNPYGNPANAPFLAANILKSAEEAPPVDADPNSPLATANKLYTGLDPKLIDILNTRGYDVTKPMAQGGTVNMVPGPEGRYYASHPTRGFAVGGAGTGQSDDIPTMLSDGEYVFDADTVAALGDGSSKAGAAVLDKMRQAIRKHKRSAPVNDIPPKAKSPLAYLKGSKHG
jgi:hypothetical protein